MLVEQLLHTPGLLPLSSPPPHTLTAPPKSLMQSLTRLDTYNCLDRDKRSSHLPEFPDWGPDSPGAPAPSQDRYQMGHPQAVSEQLWEVRRFASPWGRQARAELG